MYLFQGWWCSISNTVRCSGLHCQTPGDARDCWTYVFLPSRSASRPLRDLRTALHGEFLHRNIILKLFWLELVFEGGFLRIGLSLSRNFFLSLFVTYNVFGFVKTMSISYSSAHALQRCSPSRFLLLSPRVKSRISGSLRLGVHPKLAHQHPFWRYRCLACLISSQSLCKNVSQSDSI